MLGRLGRRATPWLARGLKDTRNGGVDLARVGARPGKKCPLCNTSFCTTASRRANATTTRAGKKSAEDARGSAQKERYNPQEPLQYMHNPNTPSRAGGDEVLAPTLADVHLFDPENLTYEDLSSSMGDAIFGEEEEKETEKRRFSPNPRPDPKASHETADRHSVESTDISDAPEKEVAKVNALYEDVEHRKRLANNTNGDILPGTDIFGARRAAVSERTDLPEMSPGRDADEVSKELSRASDSIQVIHGKICKLRSMKKQYHELAERLHDRLEVVDQLIEVVEEEELRGKMSVSRERQKLATEFVEKHGDPLEGIDCDFKLAVTASKVLDEYFRHFDMQDYLNKRISTTEMRERTQDLILAVKNVRNEIVHESAFNELKDREAFRMTFYLAWYELDEFYDEKIAEALKRSIVSAKQIKKRISVIAKQIRDGSWGEPSVIVAEITIARAINLARAIVDIAQRRVTAGASGKDLEGSMYTGACHFRNIFLLGKQITAKYPSAIILRDIQELETLIAAMRSLVRQAEEPERESAATEPESESATIEPESESAAMEPESGAEHENRRSRKARRDHDRQLQRLLQGDHAQEYRVKNGRKGREKRRKMARLRTKIEEEEEQ